MEFSSESLALVQGVLPETAAMDNLSPDLTPKWSAPECRIPRRSRRMTILAIVLAVMIAIVALIVAIKYRGAPTGHQPQADPWVPEKKSGLTRHLDWIARAHNPSLLPCGIACQSEAAKASHQSESETFTCL